VRILLWHGWHLEGSGSNVYTAKVTETARRLGHDVLLVCQAGEGSVPSFIDQVGRVDRQRVSDLSANERVTPEPGGGRAVLLRPDIGRLLPVFVLDEYEGFEAKRFVDLTSEELDGYLQRNVAALRIAATWHRSDLVVVSHVVPGGVVAARAIDDIPTVVKTHGSDLEYAIRRQDRYRELAREAIGRASRLVGASRDVLDRALAFAPNPPPRAEVIPPGVDVERFRPRSRREALEEAAALLEEDSRSGHGRPDDMSSRVAAAMGGDPDRLTLLADEYDQNEPDQGAAHRLRQLASVEGPIVAYLGKLIPEKGVELLIQALARLPDLGHGLVIGFGRHREWLQALVQALEEGGSALEWVRSRSGLQIEPAPDRVSGAPSLAGRITFTGRLDHRYAPLALAGVDILVVPSVIPEAFGMVTAEGAAAGCLPVVARHSGLAEVAETLEAHVARPGAFSFEPGPGAVERIAAAIRSLLSLPPEDRGGLRRQVSAFARSTWTWARTTELLLAPADD
jgi:glycosyltransferase involved in cell wall biosynthesis